MKLITFIGAGTFILLSAFVIKNENNTGAKSLYDKKWMLRKIHTDSGVHELVTKAFIKFNLETKSAGGNGSCNTFGSSFSITNNNISFKNIFSTKMYCEGAQDTEDSFFKQLGKVNRFKLKDKNLVFYHGDDILLEFQSE